MRWCYILFLILFSEYCLAQKTDTLYFKLKKGEYFIGKSERYVSVKTKIWVVTYSFTIPYAGKAGGYISFGSHNNPEVGEILEPVKTISRKQFSGLRFISLGNLVALMEENDNSFNRLFTLYFVEAETRRVYHVLKRTSFADYYPDVIPADTTSR